MTDIMLAVRPHAIGALLGLSPLAYMAIRTAYRSWRA